VTTNPGKQTEVTIGSLNFIFTPKIVADTARK
jgi:hypothetical protein